MEKKMETAIVYRGYIGIMEKKMEATIVFYEVSSSRQETFYAVFCPAKSLLLGRTIHLGCGFTAPMPLSARLRTNAMHAHARDGWASITTVLSVGFRT